MLAVIMKAIISLVPGSLNLEPLASNKISRQVYNVSIAGTSSKNLYGFPVESLCQPIQPMAANKCKRKK